MFKVKFTHAHYPIVIWVFFGCSQEDVVKEINTKKHPIILEDIVCDLDNYKSEEGVSTMFKPGNFLIWLKSYPTNGYWKANLAHEIFHAVAAIRTWIGAPTLTDDTEEDWAYMTTWITLHTYNKYEKWQHKEK
jgi:hypothetical protein